MDKTYDPHAIERRWYPLWEARGDFAPSGQGEPFCIMLPPPNVTGALHMGHAFQDTLMDILCRVNRMRGRNVLWQPGTDHAGIATQMVVERQLAAEGQTRRGLKREGFLARVWAWKEDQGDAIIRQMQRLGVSADWSKSRFTLDESLSEVVREVFVRLYDEDLIYRGQRLVNWDPMLYTALSDLEVVSQEEAGQLWHIRYPLTDGDGHLIVATTRPETLLGDVAVAVNPDDPRYRHLIGREVILPLAERRIPVIGDPYVDPDFGTGCLKITPAHDFNDYAIGQRHGLRPINIFTPDARIKRSDLDDFTFGHRAKTVHGTQLADGDGLASPATVTLIPERYQGLDRYEARRLIIQDLQAAGLLEKTEPHTLMVPRGDRSGAVIEPYLTDQWYVRIAPLAGPAIAAVETGRVRLVPESWTKTYFEWMRNIQDWCISRQLWWGHRIPAWYDAEGQVYVARSESEVRAKYDLPADVALTQDEDVLDTWFSSSLWPFSTLGWPQHTELLRTFYPTTVLVTGFDIIFFWVSRMVMMGLKFMDDIPFHEVYIHGLVRDSEGQKMSKSKGNVLDPIDLIDGITLDALIAKRTQGLMQPSLAPRIEAATRRQFPNGIPAFGADALRFTFASLASTGRDIKFDLARCEGYRNFCNKLWNAARFVLMNTPASPDPAGSPVELDLPARWIISQLNRVEEAITHHLDQYRFDLAASTLYDFTWHDTCDWYLELTKPVLARAASPIQRGTQRTLLEVLETLLRLLHPFVPFMTEEIWQQVAPCAGVTGETIQTRPWPTSDPSKIDLHAEHELAWVKDVVMGIRRIRSELDIHPGKPLTLLLDGGTSKDRERTVTYAPALTSLARLEAVRWLDGEPGPAAATLVGSLKLLIPLEGLIDKDTELARLAKDMARLEESLTKSQAKLSNPNFAERAPTEVVSKERDRLKALRAQVEHLRTQRFKIQGL